MYELYRTAKKTLASVLVLLCVLLVCMGIGFWRGCAYGRSETGDTERTEQHTARTGAAQDAVTELADGLGSVAEQVQSAREKIDECVSGVGELGEVGDRIAGDGQDIARAAGRIEERLRRIESIIYAAEKSDAVLADDSGDSHPD
ncbi:MAG: hypothetical protein IJP62_03405 [Treponema sp.]|nr:hypothetical protein [Treponema sp.]